MARGASSGYSTNGQLTPGQRARATGASITQSTSTPSDYWTSARMAAAQPYGMTPTAPRFSQQTQAPAPQNFVQGNMANSLGGGRTTAGYTGPHNTEAAPQYGFAGGSAPRIQVPTPPPAAGPGLANLPPQVLAILSMLGGGQAPAAQGALGQLNNGGYGMAPQGAPSLGQVQALLAMLGGGKSYSAPPLPWATAGPGPGNYINTSPSSGAQTPQQQAALNNTAQRMTANPASNFSPVPGGGILYNGPQPFFY